MAIFDLKSIPSAKPPKYCTKYFVEFGGRQQKLSAFFSQNSNLETSRTFLSTSQNSEKRKSEENGIEQSSSAPKKSKVVQQQQKSLLSFFKPKNPAKIEVPKQDDLLIVQSQENESLSQVEDFSKFEDFNPEKRVQVQTFSIKVRYSLFQIRYFFVIRNYIVKILFLLIAMLII